MAKPKDNLKEVEDPRVWIAGPEGGSQMVFKPSEEPLLPRWLRVLIGLGIVVGVTLLVFLGAWAVITVRGS